MLTVYMIVLLIVAITAWGIYAMISERTTRAASDFQEAARSLHGTFSDKSSLGKGKNLLLTCTHKGRKFSFSVVTRHGPNGDGADFGVTVPITNSSRKFLVARKTFVTSLDKLSSTCKFSKAIEADLRSRTAYVVGENQEDFAKQLRGDRRLGDAVYYLTIESGLDGFGVSNGVLKLYSSFKARNSRPDRLRMLLQELSVIADALDKPL